MSELPDDIKTEYVWRKMSNLYNGVTLFFSMLREYTRRMLPYRIKRIIYRHPIFGIYSKHYLRYKLMNCNFKQKRGILVSDLTVHWISTYNCNFYCKHCEAGAGDKSVLELSTDEICNLVTELSNMNIKRINISGGEPLVRKDIFKIIRHIINKGMEYGLASNSYLVNNFKEEFKEMKPFMYFTSIDGLEQINDDIRGKTGAFRKSLHALEFFKSLGVKSRLINTVVLPDNIQQLPELKKIIIKSAATFWRLAIPIPVGRAKNNEKMFLNDEQIKYLFDFVEDTNKTFSTEITEDAGYLGCSSMKLRQQPFFCGAGFTRCSIMPDGEVLGCQIAYDNRFSEGNIRNKSFKEIWKTGFSHFRDPKFYKELDKECIVCEHFNSCRGGCWGMRLGNKHCYKDIWSDKF